MDYLPGLGFDVLFTCSFVRLAVVVNFGKEGNETFSRKT